MVDPGPLAWPDGSFSAPTLKSALRPTVRASAWSGQRKSRRSEITGIRIEDLVDEEPVHADPRNATSPLPPCLTLNLDRTKTTNVEDKAHAVLIGRPVEALKQWIREAKIEAGPIFRRIGQYGLRSGYLTEAANRGIPLQEAMQQSLHKSVAQAASY